MRPSFHASWRATVACSVGLLSLAPAAIAGAATPGDASLSPAQAVQASVSMFGGFGAEVAPAPPPPQPPRPPRRGFDTCEVPTVAEMANWAITSPYSVIGIYIGGPSRFCSNAPLQTPDWLNAVRNQGWSVIPTYVGLQAPCTTFQQRIDPAIARAQGESSAQDAAVAGRAAGLGRGSAIYLDVEGYGPGDVACNTAVVEYIAGWTTSLRAEGFLSGLYGSLNSAVAHASWVTRAQSAALVDAVWVAAWNGNASVNGFEPELLSDDMWVHARIHQYAGDHREMYGGVTLMIDSNIVDGPVDRAP